MYLKIALIIAILLQLYAAIVAISLIKRTKYNISWILLTIALLFMAWRRVFNWFHLSQSMKMTSLLLQEIGLVSVFRF